MYCEIETEAAIGCPGDTPQTVIASPKQDGIFTDCGHVFALQHRAAIGQIEQHRLETQPADFH
jgi:hypothetical protein